MPKRIFPTARCLVATTFGEPPGTALGDLGLRDGNDVDGDGVELDMALAIARRNRNSWIQPRGWTYAEVLEQVLGLAVDVELAALRVLGKVQG